MVPLQQPEKIMIDVLSLWYRMQLQTDKIHLICRQQTRCYRLPAIRDSKIATIFFVCSVADCIVPVKNIFLHKHYDELK